MQPTALTNDNRDRAVEPGIAYLVTNVCHRPNKPRIQPRRPPLPFFGGGVDGGGVDVGVDRAFCAYARCSATGKDTTSGKAAAAPIVAMNCLRLGSLPDVFTRFCSCRRRIASSARSSVMAGLSECCMRSVTRESVVGSLHASQAAPAVSFNAKTVSFLASTMTVEPSGSLFTTRASELVRSTCILTSLLNSISGGGHSTIISIVKCI